MKSLVEKSLDNFYKRITLKIYLHTYKQKTIKYKISISMILMNVGIHV